ncbi:FAD-dependent monooxygenase [Streptomyces sp. NPDC058877]|uniref:FAD-dependent monooxygenase n=1 Tax=Streptomyces sp. NPDC058877 TaxID=3346665 RepID=UPI0036A87205
MQHTQVLIVGAGPTGLALAARLNRFGVMARIIDKHAGVLEATKSAALHARTLEHLRTLEVADRVLAEGQRVDVLQLRTAHRDRIAVDFRTLRDTAYPHMTDIPQARTEHILIDRLADAGVSIERNTTCTRVEQTDDAVTVTVATPEGGTDRIAADWLVGCDGAHSTVRSQLGIAFAGDAYTDDWVLCDAIVDWPLPRNEMTFSADADGICGVFPLPGERRYRLAYTQNRAADGTLVEPSLADAQQALRRAAVTGTIRSVDEFWTFRLAHKQAVRYRSGRVFLAGDAAHVHTPFGGQGLNLGIGDAMNLGWKLASVVTGRSPGSLLDTYQPERHRIARDVVAFTHRGATAMLLRDDARRHLRDAVMTLLQHAPPAQHGLARRFSQLGHSYRRTPRIPGRGSSLAAGDRLPDPLLFDGLTNRSVRLHDLLPSDACTLLLTTTADADPVDASLTELYRRWHGVLTGTVLTTRWGPAVRRGTVDAVPAALDRGRQAARLYGRGPMAYLVRPDRHLAYAGPPDAARIEDCLGSIHTAPARPSSGAAAGTVGPA